jgi:hypothetical protein
MNPSFSKPKLLRLLPDDNCGTTQLLMKARAVVIFGATDPQAFSGERKMPKSIIQRIKPISPKP